MVKDGVVRAVVLNSGGANCYTGPEGFQTTHAVAEQVAGHLGIGAGDVVVCSTGLIGLVNPRQDLLDGVDAAAAALSEEGGGGSSYEEVRQRVVAGPAPEPTPEEVAAYGAVGELAAEPATAMECGWAATWLARPRPT